MKLTKTNEYGKEFILKFLNPGEFIGYTSLIADENYSYGAVAVNENTELSLIPKLDFIKLLFANKDVSAQFIKMLANNVIDKEERLLALAYSSVRKRVGNAVLSLYEEQKKASNTTITILRNDLAHIVSTAKESVIRMLTEFKEDGYLDIQDGVITVLNSGKLRDMNC